MSAGDWTADPNSLTLPPGATTGDARIVIGPDIPPELYAFYVTGLGFLFGGAILFYAEGSPDTDYGYIGSMTITSGGAAHIVYGIVRASVVYEQVDQFASATGIFEFLKQYADGTAGNLGKTFYSGVSAGSSGYATDGLVNIGSTIDFQIENGGGTAVSQPRGYLDDTRSSSSAAALTAETVVATSGSFVWRKDRAVRIRFRQPVQYSAAGTVTWRIRKTNLAGIALAAVGSTCAIGTDTLVDFVDVINTSGADITAAYCLTLQVTAGTVTPLASGTNQRQMTAEDAGTATQYTGAKTIT